MKTQVYRFCFMILLWAVCSCSISANVSVIPQPQSIVYDQGSFTVNHKTVVVAPLASQRLAAAELVRLFRRSASILLDTTARRGKTNFIAYQEDLSINAEGYKVVVDPRGINIWASDAAGYLYATQTLLQLLPAEIFSECDNSIQQWAIPCLTIQDAPKFAYRGFMLDVSRYFLPAVHIYKLLDYLALHKINKLHWHLVDDNGWRLEIKKYPKLTSIGGYRVDRQGIFPMRKNPIKGEPTPSGGYYTQEQVKSIVAYAKRLCIEVIPEIEMPAHTNSSLAAYPHLACPVVDRDQLGTLPGIGGHNATAIYCAGKEEVFHFLEDVIDEVVTLFPSSYIHIGGDEALKDNWKKCPLCQQRMKDNDIPNEEELQSYFLRRMNRYIISKGKRIMGWDELVDSEIPEEATIFGWRGKGNGAVKAAQQGHQIVLTPARYFYLTRYQGPQWFEPYAYFGNNTLEDVYGYDASMSGLPDSLQNKLLGLQACMWAEFLYSWENTQYMIFPRLAALSDNSWSQHPKDWSGFLKRLDHMTQIYTYKGINYAHSMFNLFHRAYGQNGALWVKLSCIRPDVEIRYTVDSTTPTAQSLLYIDSVRVNKGERLIAATFVNGERKGDLLHLNTLSHKAVGCEVEGLGIEEGYRLTNGVLGSERFTDGEYLDAYDRDIVCTIDLRTPTQVNKVIVNMMINAGMAAVYPAAIKIESSTDNSSFTEISSRSFPIEERFVQMMSKVKIELTASPVSQAQYLRITVSQAGKLPLGVLREGQSTRFVIDEVEVY